MSAEYKIDIASIFRMSQGLFEKSDFLAMGGNDIEERIGN